MLLEEEKRKNSIIITDNQNFKDMHLLASIHAATQEKKQLIDLHQQRILEYEGKLKKLNEERDHELSLLNNKLNNEINKIMTSCEVSHNINYNNSNDNSFIHFKPIEIYIYIFIS